MYMYKNHFLQTDFTTPERKQLNRAAVPCSLESTSQDPKPQLPDSPLMAQDAMKVSLAAQVMSHTVGASLNTAVALGKERCVVMRSKAIHMNLTEF